MKKILIAAFFANLVGCGTTQLTQLDTLVSHSKQNQFPVISVSFDRQAGCIQYGCSSNDNNGQTLINALTDSGQFSRVDVDNAFDEYKLIISYYVKSNTNGGVTLGNFLLSLGSLGTIPLIQDESYVVNLRVLKKDQLIKAYSYKRDLTGYAANWHNGINSNEVFKSIISEFIADVTKDKFMPNS